MAAAERAEESAGTGCGELFCRGVPVLNAQLIMAELSMQTPRECILSQFSRAPSELPLTGSDVALPLSQSPYSVLFSTIASDALAVPLLPPLVLSSLYSRSLACLLTLPLPHFLPPRRRHAFLEPQHLKQRGFQ